MLVHLGPNQQIYNLLKARYCQWSQFTPWTMSALSSNLNGFPILNLDITVLRLHHNCSRRYIDHYEPIKISKGCFSLVERKCISAILDR
jgi:hypothetical protein